MNTRNLLVKNTFWLGLVEAFSKVIMFGVTVSLVRYLGPRDFGTYNLAFSYVAMFMILADFGLNTIATRDMAKHRDLTDKYTSNLLGLKLLLSLIIAISIIVSLFVLPTSGTKTMILMVMFYNLVQNIGSIFTTIFVAWERMKLVFITKLAYYLGILISAFSVIYFHGSTINIIIAYGITTTLSVLFSALLIHRLGIKIKIAFDKAFCKELLIETIPFMGLAIVGTVYANNDTLLIGKFLGSTQVGFYQSAYKILFAFQSINVINNAIFPRLNVLIHENKTETLSKLIKIVVVLSILGLIPLATIITIFQNQIITLIYKPAFLPAASTMAILVWVGVVNYFRNLTSNLLFAQKKQHQVFLATTVGLVVNLTLNLIFIPQFGFIAAAWAFLAGETAILLVTIFSLVKNEK